MHNLVKIIGALGIILISVGIIKRKRKTQVLYFIAGGICLEVYSIFIGDIIFIILQLVFIASALYDYFRNIKDNKNFEEHDRLKH